MRSRERARFWSLWRATTLKRPIDWRRERGMARERTRQPRDHMSTFSSYSCTANSSGAM
jgi:hypothetical protein